MKTLVNWITFVRNVFLNDTDKMFLLSSLYSTTLENTAALSLWTRSSKYIFWWKSFLIVLFIGMCYTTWWWLIKWIMFMLTWCFFVRFFSRRYFNLFIGLSNFSDTFVNLYFYFSKKVHGLRPGKYFLTLWIVPIFMILLFFGDNI